MEDYLDEDDVPQIYLLGKTYLASNEKFYIRNDSIIYMAAGDRHTILVTESGRAYAFGDNNCGQLGLGHLNDVLKVSCIKSLKFGDTGEKVILAACGRESSLIATNRGSLYGFGSNSHCQLGFESDEATTIHSSPVKIKYFHSRISWEQISMGAEHTCALTTDGEVYVWGSNEEGQCGQIRKYNIIKTPRELELESIVNSISCGYYHTALISEDRRLFLFGSNSDRQLGSSKSEQHNNLLEVSLPDFVTAVACGHQHTVVLTEKGEVYTCGKGDRGQLGLGTRVLSTAHFQRVENLPASIVTIAAGEGHTGVIGSHGDLYVFGNGRNGQLSYKNHSDEFQPRSITKFEEYDVLNIVCGGCQTIVLAHKGQSLDSEEEIETRTDTAGHYVEPFYISSAENHSQSPPLRVEPSDNTFISLSDSMKSQIMNSEYETVNGTFQPRRLLNQTSNDPINNENSEPMETKPNHNNNKSLPSSMKSSVHNNRLNSNSTLQSPKNPHQKISFNENTNQNLRPISSSPTGSGYASSSTSSSPARNGSTDSETNDNLGKNSSFPATEILPKPDATNSVPTESQPGFFARIFSTKSAQKMSTATNKNSRTCSIM